MKRLACLMFVFVLNLVSLFPPGASAQDFWTLDDDLGHGEGIGASDVVGPEIVWMVEEIVIRINNRDSTAINLVDPAFYGLWFSAETYDESVANIAQGIPEIVVYDISDVRVHEDGAFSTEVTLSGWNPWSYLYTDRFFLQANDTGSYVFTGAAKREVNIPTQLQVAEVELTYSLEAMTVSETTYSGVDALQFHVRNDEAVPMTAGLYETLEGVSEADLRTSLSNYDYSQSRYLGPLFLRPQSEWTFTFVVESGSTYYLQAYEFLDDEVTDDVVILEGDQFFATLTN